MRLEAASVSVLRRGGPHGLARRRNLVTLQPRVYVACLASYNAGELVGRWLDVPEDAETLESEIRDMLRASPVPGAEEWAIHDYEGFGGLEVHEYTNTAEVIALGSFVRKHGQLGASLAALLGSAERARQHLEFDYGGSYESLEAWADAHLADSGLLSRVPDVLRPYLDTARYARDLVASGALMTLRVKESLHVFWTT